MTVKKRVIAYVDGFNLYFGLLDAGLSRYKWLDINQLVLSILKDNQELVELKYFTSRVSNDPDKTHRQNIYIEALETKGIKIYYGHYQRGTVNCNHCGCNWQTYNEKMTDVNIATQLLIDAHQDKFDVAMLISGDSDLVPPIKAIHKLFENKRVFVAFPPKRTNTSISINAKGNLTIGKNKIKRSQFPNEITKGNGYVLKKPPEW
ncbi:MAG TPA: NYN domain-containing protein [Ignavibacteria bacterium]|nr:NYN domain-containing protein [Ignavibacteria bacterium]